MKKQFLLLFFLMLSGKVLWAQCSWIEGGGYLTTGQGTWSITTDAADNVYSTGAFIDSIHFGTLGLYNPNTAFSNYVNKFSTTGAIQWAVQFQGTSQGDVFPPVICQKNSALYIAGTYYDTLYYNYTNNQLLTSPGFNLFLIKLDLNGNVLWAKTYKGSVNVYGHDDLLGITVNNKSELYITGTFNDSLAFGTTVIQAAVAQDNQAFLAKIDSNGNALWALASTSVLGAPHNRGWGITTDINGNVLVAGTCDSTITFGSKTFNGHNNVGYGGNPYVAKFDSTGNCLWINGGTGDGQYVGLYDVATDAKANVYAGGSLNATQTFSGNTISTANGSFYVCKYSAAGNLVKIIQTGDTSTGADQAVSAMVADDSNHLWISGWINSPATFGNVTFSNYGVYSVELDTNLNLLTALQSQGTGDTYSSAVDNNGNLYVACLGFGDTLIFNGDTDVVAAIDTPASDIIYKYCVSPGEGNGYIPMFGYHHQWYEDEFWVGEIPEGQVSDNLQYNLLDASGDTTISNKLYYRAAVQYRDTSFLFREDNATQRVWIKTDTGDKLLYDFSLLKGDSVYLSFDFQDSGANSFNQTGWYYVDSVKTVNIYAGPRKALFLSNPKNGFVKTYGDTVAQNLELEWIEQIGSTIAPDYLQRDISEFGGDVYYWPYYYILLCSFNDIGELYHGHGADEWSPGFAVSDSCALFHPGGINRVATNNEITVFPNPTTGQLTISSNQLPINSITVTNLLGQTVLKSPSGDLGATKQTIDVSTLPDGLYFVTVATGSETETSKIVVTK